MLDGKTALEILVFLHVLEGANFEILPLQNFFVSKAASTKKSRHKN